MLSRFLCIGFMLGIALLSRSVAAYAQVDGKAQGSMPVEELTVSGQVVEGGVECPLFRTDDGQTYSLSTITKAEAPVGVRMRLRGQVQDVSTCMQGTAFAVSERLE